jgi:putative phosphoribosyl transferase
MPKTMIYRDRSEAGKHLAARLVKYVDRDDVLVMALPRGGVPVGFEVAKALHAPLDVFLVRKLGVPGQEELAMVQFLPAAYVFLMTMSSAICKSQPA